MIGDREPGERRQKNDCQRTTVTEAIRLELRKDEFTIS